MASGFAGRLPAVTLPTPVAAQHSPGGDNPRTVRNFLQNPSPTLLPQDQAGVPALPLPQHMVGGSPYPHSAQTKLASWNRATGGPPMPAGVTFNAPRNRMTQT